MRSSRESLQQRIDALPLHRRAWLTWKLYRDPHVSPMLKRTITIGALAYVASPIDILPDVLLGIGQVDDLGILAGMVFMLSSLLVKFAPEEVLLNYLDGTYDAPTR
ncbi:MAG TPA: DUF1232 domain-containing protein, partial [Thermomicrobiales bacterium]|nr:DUF1232 domain-containing protein [Thermomicrobiales bacterium]